MGGINEATEVARGISEQGFLVMTAAFFLVLSAMMMVACFKWFKSIITKSMEDYGESLKELIEKTNDQNNMLSDISEGLRPETTAPASLTSAALTVEGAKTARMSAAAGSSPAMRIRLKPTP